MDQAQRLFNEVFQRGLRQFNFVSTFRHVFSVALSSTGPAIISTYDTWVNDLMTNPVYAGWVDKTKLAAMGGKERLVSEATTASVKDSVTAVNAACLIFAHSILDGMAFEYCRVSTLAGPSDWETVVERRKVPLGDVMKRDGQSLFLEAVATALDALERESVLKKVETLYARCSPPAGFNSEEGYRYERARLEALDTLRHEIIHGEAMVRGEVGDTSAGVFYLQQTSIHLAGLLNHRYRLTLSPEYQFELWTRP